MRGGLWFCGFLVLSAAAHLWIIGTAGAGLKSTPPRADILTSVEIIEESRPEMPPAPPPPEEPPPPPPPEPPPPSPEEILSAPDSGMQASPIATPAPTPPPAASATPKPRPAPAATPSTRPQPSRPAVSKPAGRPMVDRAVPVVQRNSPPRYPEFARKKGWEGRVVVRVSVDPSGRPRSAKVQTGSGYGVLDQAALQTVKGWQFHPRVVAGTPVEGVVDVPVNFSLRGR